MARGHGLSTGEQSVECSLSSLKPLPLGRCLDRSGNGIMEFMSREPVDARADSARTESRRRVLQVIDAFPEGCGVQTVAERTGLHPNTVRFHLERLEADGLVRREVRHGGEHGRPPLVYTAAAVPEAGPEHREFGQLTNVLARLIARTNPDPVGSAIEAGRSWGLEVLEDSTDARSPEDAVAVLVEILTRIGFVPKVSRDRESTVILQRHCPFLEAAQAHPEVVCSVHLGLMRGVLESLNVPVIAESLIPFAGPAGCEARLRELKAVNAQD